MPGKPACADVGATRQAKALHHAGIGLRGSLNAVARLTVQPAAEVEGPQAREGNDRLADFDGPIFTAALSSGLVLVTSTVGTATARRPK